MDLYRKISICKPKKKKNANINYEFKYYLRVV